MHCSSVFSLFQIKRFSRSHLYRLRTRFLRDRAAFAAKRSGGDHWPDWPPQARAFLQEFLPLHKPPNFQPATTPAPHPAALATGVHQ